MCSFHYIHYGLPVSKLHTGVISNINVLSESLDPKVMIIFLYMYSERTVYLDVQLICNSFLWLREPPLLGAAVKNVFSQLETQQSDVETDRNPKPTIRSVA